LVTKGVIFCALQAVQEELDNGIVRAKVRRSQMVVSEDVRRRHQTEQALLDSKEPLPEAEMAAARRNLIKHMLPRETVMQALTRLGGKRSQNPVSAVACALMVSVYLCLCLTNTSAQHDDKLNLVNKTKANYFRITVILA
jgi:hypothetical protein